MSANKKQQTADINDRFQTAVDRAKKLGIGHHVLQAAHSDGAWKRCIEAAVSHTGPTQKLARGGGKVADMWGRSLTHDRIARGIEDDLDVLKDVALACPEILALKNGEPPEAEEIAALEPLRSVLAAFALRPLDEVLCTEALERACAAMEAAALDLGAQPAQQRTECSKKPRVTESPEARQLAEAKRQLKETKAELGKRCSEVSRKDRKVQDLKNQLQVSASDCSKALAEAGRLRAERDQLKRDLRGVQALLDSATSGKRTVEQRRTDEAVYSAQTIADLRGRVAASEQVVQALESQLRATRAELDEEQARTAELEETLSAFGLDDAGLQLASLQAALDGLGRVRAGVAAYAARQREREREALRLRNAAELQAHAADEARRLQLEQEEAWAGRERDRFEDMERALFPDGQVDHILIDGHNLVHRVFRPEDEARTRPWLERMVEAMAERLEARGWSTRVHLCFDTQHGSSDRSGAHGVRVYFKNRPLEGGADACIAELLREGNPAANYMIISTDRRHVWSDAEDYMRAEGAAVDLVQIELLASYLQALDDILDDKA